MSTKKECWDKYAGHIKNWYVNTYESSKGKVKAINEGRLIRNVIRKYSEQTTKARLKAGGVSEFAAGTVMLYIKNTKESYLTRCIAESGGFASDVACMSDNDCPRGYRCRGLGVDSECIPEGEPIDSEKIVLPEPPKIEGSIKLPDFGIGKSTKAIIGLVMFVFLVLLFLVALGYSGLGGAAGKAAEKRV